MTNLKTWPLPEKVAGIFSDDLVDVARPAQGRKAKASSFLARRDGVCVRGAVVDPYTNRNVRNARRGRRVPSVDEEHHSEDDLVCVPPVVSVPAAEMGCQQVTGSGKVRREKPFPVAELELLPRVVRLLGLARPAPKQASYLLPIICARAQG